MTTKRCVYKGCENAIVRGVPSGSFTLFNFPKDPDRRNLWIELGKVSPQILPNAMLMCSHHFDRKYFSMNQRRTILIGAAIPHPYHEEVVLDEVGTLYEQEQTEPEEEEIEIEEDALSKTQSSLTATEEAFDEAAAQKTTEFELDITSVESPEQNDVFESDDEEEEEYIVQGENLVAASTAINKSNDSAPKTATALEALSHKRKAGLLAIADGKRWKRQVLVNNKEVRQFQKGASTISQITSRANNHNNYIQNNHQTSYDVCEEDKQEEELIDSKNVTTFIYKGGEYVQMSKEFYLKERETLLRQLRKYESVINNLRHCLGNLD